MNVNEGSLFDFVAWRAIIFNHLAVLWCDIWNQLPCLPDDYCTGLGFYVPSKHHPTIGNVISNRYLFWGCETNPTPVMVNR